MFGILLGITALALIFQMVRGVSRLLSLILLVTIGITLFIGYGGGNAFSAVAAVFSIVTALIVMAFTFKLTVEAISASFAKDTSLTDWGSVFDGILLFVVNISSIVTIYDKVSFLIFLWS